MIIKNAAFIFDLLTNKLTRSKTLEAIEFSKWTTSNSGAGFGSISDCYDRKNISDCNQSVFFYFISIKQWLIEICHYFSLNAVSLWLSVSKQRMLLLPLLSVKKSIFLLYAVLCVKLWFFGFDTTGFHNFFWFSGIGQSFRLFSRLDTLSHY